MSKEIWLRTNELNEAIKSLESVAQFLPLAGSDTYYWKWVIIALHNSLQGFMVCAVKGTSGLNVLKKESRDKWLEAYRKGDKELPPEILETYLNLYKKIKSGEMIMYYGSRNLIPTDEQEWSVKQLNSLRNKFTHFIPGLWSLEVTGMPDIVFNCLSVIDFLAFESGNIIFYEDNSQEIITELIKKIKAELNKILTESASLTFEQQ